MDNQQKHLQLLGELDIRQNDLLRRLEELDLRVKRVLDECMGNRKAAATPFEAN